jgi:hypothetical protein
VEQASEHRKLMRASIERDGEGQRALLAGDRRAAREAFAAAAALYRQSWEAAPPGSYGRLVGMLKSVVLAGGGRAEAEYARSQLAQEKDPSATASYALAIAALILEDDDHARQSAVRMRSGEDAFERTADAIVALADRDGEAFARALRVIVDDFESREQFLTNVPVADTALMLERLAERRGMPAGVDSPLLPRDDSQSTKQ